MPTTSNSALPPGVGKSQVVKQVADKLGIEMIDLRLSQLDPVDLK